MVELVDAPDSKSGTERCVGSIPTEGTITFSDWIGGTADPIANKEPDGSVRLFAKCEAHAKHVGRKLTAR